MQWKCVKQSGGVRSSAVAAHLNGTHGCISAKLFRPLGLDWSENSTQKQKKSAYMLSIISTFPPLYARVIQTDSHAVLPLC